MQRPPGMLSGGLSGACQGGVRGAQASIRCGVSISGRPSRSLSPSRYDRTDRSSARSRRKWCAEATSVPCTHPVNRRPRHGWRRKPIGLAGTTSHATATLRPSRQFCSGESCGRSTASTWCTVTSSAWGSRRHQRKAHVMNTLHGRLNAQELRLVFRGYVDVPLLSICKCPAHPRATGQPRGQRSTTVSTWASSTSIHDQAIIR
jgi:hypothetical protein